MIVQTWQHRAACRNHPNPDLWFPNQTDDAARATAKAICAGCPVRADCLTDAMQPGMRSYVRGIWGGTTERERAELIKHGWRPARAMRKASA